MKREDMIEACVESTNDWDCDALLAYVQEVMTDMLEQIDDGTLISQYQNMVDEDFEGEVE